MYLSIKSLNNKIKSIEEKYFLIEKEISELRNSLISLANFEDLTTRIQGVIKDQKELKKKLNWFCTNYPKNREIKSGTFEGILRERSDEIENKVSSVLIELKKLEDVYKGNLFSEEDDISSNFRVIKLEREQQNESILKILSNFQSIY